MKLNLISFKTMKTKFFILAVLAMISVKTIGQSKISFDNAEEIIKVLPNYIYLNKEDIVNKFGEGEISPVSDSITSLIYETTHANIYYIAFIIDKKTNQVLGSASLISNYYKYYLINKILKNNFYRELYSNEKDIIFIDNNRITYQFIETKFKNQIYIMLHIF